MNFKDYYILEDKLPKGAKLVFGKVMVDGKQVGVVKDGKFIKGEKKKKEVEKSKDTSEPKQEKPKDEPEEIPKDLEDEAKEGKLKVTKPTKVKASTLGITKNTLKKLGDNPVGRTLLSIGGKLGSKGGDVLNNIATEIDPALTNAVKGSAEFGGELSKDVINGLSDTVKGAMKAGGSAKDVAKRAKEALEKRLKDIIDKQKGD